MVDRTCYLSEDRPIYPDSNHQVKCLYCQFLSDSCRCKFTDEWQQGISLLRKCERFQLMAGGPEYGRDNPPS